MNRPPTGRNYTVPVVLLMIVLVLVAAGVFFMTRRGTDATVSQSVTTPAPAGPPSGGSTQAAASAAGSPAPGTTTATVPSPVAAGQTAPSPVAAASPVAPGSLRGVVVSAVTNQPIQGATIAYSGQAITSTATGEFSLINVPAEAKVTVTAPGFDRTTISPAPTPATVKLEPWSARGIYATVFGIADRGLRQGMEEVMTDTSINAIVIDVKGDRAGILYPSKVPLAEKIGANELNTLAEGDIEELIRKYHEKGIYVIARVVVFKDDLLARNGREAGLDVAIRRPDGEVWVDGEDLAWVDATREEGWDYTIAIAKEAAEKGFDEIQYDYIRFPTDPAAGNSVSAAQYSKPNTEENRVAAIAGFLKKSDSVLRPMGVKSSIDTFGYTTWRYDDTGIGQDMRVLADHVDYISPMVYPSTYNSGLPIEEPIEFPEVVNHPYEVVYESVRRAVERVEGKRAKIRPWLQYFDDYPWQTAKKYGREEIAAQVQATIDAGASGWLFWDPFNEYEHGAIFDDELPKPKVTPTPTPGAASPSPAASPAASPTAPAAVPSPETGSY